MIRRGVLGGLLAAALLSACAGAQTRQPTPEASAFQSERIAITVTGSGPDVILIPGLTSSSSVWDTTRDALAGRYRVHVVQVRGFAGTEPVANASGDVSAPVAEEIARYIEHVHLDHPAVIGHSMGGTIGMMLAARHPESVGRLMVVDMFPWMGAMFGPPGATAESVRPVAEQMRERMRGAPQGASSSFTTQMIAGMVRTESARPELERQSRESNNITVANAFYELIVTDLRPELANIRAPLTVLYVIPPNLPITAEQYEGYMRASYASGPSARLVKIEDSYHFIMIDQFDRFMSEVNTFLAG
ncbi:alpha/beta fold hydrolase [Terricaulis sp.]|uniref:alpha/beta fold hydrolase n=1 Tax=Terricaulis sp. TaxID=2768686 RepID=UPI003783C4AB